MTRSAPIVSVGTSRRAKHATQYALAAAGAKWNRMNSDQRHELLLKAFFPCEATSKLTLQPWQLLLRGHKVLIALIMRDEKRRSA
jgi:hypothetical protein